MPLCWTKNQHGKAFEEKDKPEDLPQEYASIHRFEEKRSGFTFYRFCKGTWHVPASLFHGNQGLTDGYQYIRLQAVYFDEL